MKKQQYSEQKKNWFLYVGGAITIVMAALIVDNFGRDIFSLFLQGAGMTFFIAVCVVAIGAVCGTVIGGLTGYFGGWGDEALMRVCDAITAFPSILLALVVIAVLGPGKWNVIWVLGILFIPSFARIVRGEFVKCKNLNYIRSARLMGTGHVPCPCCCPPFPSASTTPSWRRPA